MAAEKPNGGVPGFCRTTSCFGEPQVCKKPLKTNHDQK